MNERKLNPAVVGGLHPSEQPELQKAADKCQARKDSTGEEWAVWIRPNSTTCFTVEASDRMEGCVEVFNTEDGWIQIPSDDME